MSIITRTRATLTVEQVYALAELEFSDDVDISRARGECREIDVEFTESEAGGRHLYVQDREKRGGLYHIARNGNTTWCERS